MDWPLNVPSDDTMSILLVIFTALAAASLVPAVHKFLPWAVEVVIWMGMIGLSILRVTTIRDPEVRESTVSLAWAAGELAKGQLSILGNIVRAWLVGNRFGIATVVLVVAGVDALALAMIRSRRMASREMPQVLLGDWFVIPLRREESRADALAELDRGLAVKTRTVFQSVAHSAPARAVFVKPIAHAGVHLLGPGPARLRMVKLALGMEGHMEPSTTADATEKRRGRLEAPVLAMERAKKAKPETAGSPAPDAGRGDAARQTNRLAS